MDHNIQEEIDKLIDLYFNQPKVLYDHLFSSFHQFVGEIIPYSLIQEANYFYENVDQHLIYLHGFKCSNIRIKPSVFENDNEIKFPSDARKNHLNYFASIVVDIQQFVEKVDSITGDKIIKYVDNMEKNLPIGNIPIMLKSKYCSTHIKQDLKGECKIDPGGYFIVNGQEKIVMSIEQMVNNKILVFVNKDASYENGLIYKAQINSKRNDWSDNLQILTIKNRKDGVLTVSTSSQLVDIPLFILMRALGIETDRNIISYLTYDLDDIKMLNLLQSSIVNSVDETGNPIKTKEEAIEFLITKLKRNKRISQTDVELGKIQKKMYLDKILRQDLLPHLGEDIPKKIVFLGLITNRLLNVMLGRRDVDDRDALHNKRIEPPGILLGQLFRQNWKKLLNEIGKHFKKKNQSDENPINVIGQIKPSTIEQGLKTALSTGIWGMNKTKRGVAQSLQRLSWIQGTSYLRRILSPSMDESTAKVTSIRQVNSNQCQLLCCLTGDSEVLMSNRITLKQIINIHDGESVSSVNRITLCEEPSRIYNKFSRMSEKLYEIKTLSGRVIKATNDHPFLICENNKFVMKKVEDLKLTDKLVIRHTEKIIVPDIDTCVIINEADVLDNYKIELLELGYLNKPITQDRLVIIARLVGSINTDGHLGLKIISDKIIHYDASFYVGEEFDTFILSDDISKLGFGYPVITREINKFKNKTNERITNCTSICKADRSRTTNFVGGYTSICKADRSRTTNFVGGCTGKDKIFSSRSQSKALRCTTWKVGKNGAFAYILSLLGGLVGKKTDMKRVIPEWIIKGNKLIKREYLSAFQGGNGCKISYQINNASDTFRVFIGITSQTTILEFENDTIKYMNQLSSMFKDFDINTKVNSRKSNNKNKKIIDLVFEKTDNIVKYVDWIGYRYCEEKRRKSAPAIEYLKIRQEEFNDRSIKYNKISKMFSENYLNKEISNNCDISVKQVNKLRNIIKKGGKFPEPRFSCPIIYDQFTRDNILSNGDISIGIKYIKPIPNEMVYDFTTESYNHSFIANSFVVSNCIETPEGAKIGIVKSLAMMASITVQNSSQNDIINNILKNNPNIKHPYDIDPLSMNQWIKIFSNGNWIGVCKIPDALEIYRLLKKYRSENIIDKFTSILFDYTNKEIRLYFDGGRLIRPLLIVNNNKLNFTPEIIKDINIEMGLPDKSKSWKKILHKYPDFIEYEDIESLNYLLVAEREYKLNKTLETPIKLDHSSASEAKEESYAQINRYSDHRWVKYTHCDFHSWVMLGTVAANIPFSNHNYANRNILHFSQAKQSIGIYLSSYKDRIDISQILYHPQLPLVTTQAMKYNGVLDLPYGENTIIAICSYNGYNQEDSIIFNQSAIDRGIFRADTLKKYHSEILKNPSTSQDDIFTKPDRNKVTGMKHGNYEKLNEKGYVPEETVLNNEDIIIGKISPIQPTGNNNKVYKDNSEIFKSNVQGVIDRVHTGIYNVEGYEMYNVRVRMERKPMVGDKFTCYDDSHDVLTTDGWINIKDVTLNHKVASLVDNKLVYQYPTQVQSYDYNGDMYLIESNQVSLCVTPNHRMWVRPRCSTDYKIELAQDIMNKRRHYKKNVEDIIVDRNDKYFVYDKDNKITHFKLFLSSDIDDESTTVNSETSSKLNISETQSFSSSSKDNLKFKINQLISEIQSNLIEQPIDEISFKDISQKSLNESKQIKESEIQILDIKSWLLFFGIWIAEGWVDKHHDYVRIAAHKDRVKEALMEINSNLQWNYNWTQLEHKICYYITNKLLGRFMSKYNVGAINKFLPEWVWNLSSDLCKILIDGMMLGDGHTMVNGTRRYDTSSTRLANDFQRLCLHAGYATNISIKYKAGHTKIIKSSLTNPKKIGTTITSTVDAYRLTIIETQVEPIVNAKIKNDNGIMTANHDSYIKYIGKVYCCSVSGSGVIYIRRDNVPVWCGNSFHGQKSTVGITYKQKDMPFTESGIIPDLILNPHGFPSRMSLGQFIECLAAKQAAETGTFVDGTPFSNYDVKELPKALKKIGFSPYGTEVMYCGLTGRKMDVEIFMGPVYNIRLKHMVLDKVHGRARGPKQALTRQPLEGRSRDGGLKIGEMEKDAMVAHGMGQFLKERLMETSDITKVHVCDDCGMFAAKVIDKDYYRCKGCHNSTRISAIVIPHACKLLFQELTSVNILPRIRTEKSVYSNES